MADITTFLGLEKPIGGEKFSRAMLNRNHDRIESYAAARPDPLSISTASSTFNDATWNATPSSFTRIKLGDTGIVVAHIHVLIDAATTLPINTASGSVIAGLVPQGYRPKQTKGMMPCVISGLGRGQGVQAAVNGTTGDVTVRSESSTAYTTVVGTTLYLFVTYEWDGVV